jgi:Protein of unknown function (DUF4232)
LLAAAVIGAVIAVRVASPSGPSTPRVSPHTSPRVVVWIDAPVAEPSAVPTSIEGVPRCPASQVSATFLTTWGAAGNDANVLAITNRGSTPCYVRGRPRVRLVTTDGRRLPPSVANDGTFFPDDGPVPIRLQPGTTPPQRDGLLRPGQAQLAVEWIDCDRRDQIAAFLIELTTGTVTVRVDPELVVRSAEPACDSNPSARGSSTRVNNFQRRRLGSGPSSDMAILGATILGPSAAEPGSRLRYLVTLTDPEGPTGNTVPLDTDPCPAYQESLALGSTVVSRRYLLNCSGLVLSSDHSVTFEMFIDVPPNISGTATLTWVLDPDRLGPSAQTAVVFPARNSAR